ncbi:MAG: zf-HC2 domain-containing protein [Bacteroidota bacterium]
MNCELFSENLFAYHEGTLPGELLKPYKDHLASCKACQRLNSGFRNLAEIIETEKVTEPNPFAATRIIQRIEAEFEKSQSGIDHVWIRILQPVAIAIALMVGILIGTYSAKTGKSSANQLVNKENHIQFLKSDLYISEFTDEDKNLVLNK